MIKVSLRILKLQNSKGSLLIEVLAAVAVGAVIVTSIVQLGVKSLKDSRVSEKQAELTRYAQQGVEAVRSIRDQNIKNAFVDPNCSFVVGSDPAADVATCNEWVDVWRWNYSTSRDFRLIPANAGSFPVLPTPYWRMEVNSPESLPGGITRKVTLSETTPSDPGNIKKVTVATSFVDGPNTYQSVQETYLRRVIRN